MYTVFTLHVCLHAGRGHQISSWMVVKDHVITGNLTQDSGTLNLWAISPALEILISTKNAQKKIHKGSIGRNSQWLPLWQSFSLFWRMTKNILLIRQWSWLNSLWTCIKTLNCTFKWYTSVCMWSLPAAKKNKNTTKGKQIRNEWIKLTTMCLRAKQASSNAPEYSKTGKIPQEKWAGKHWTQESII